MTETKRSAETGAQKAKPKQQANGTRAERAQLRAVNSREPKKPEPRAKARVESQKAESFKSRGYNGV